MGRVQGRMAAGAVDKSQPPLVKLRTRPGGFEEENAVISQLPLASRDEMEATGRDGGQMCQADPGRRHAGHHFHEMTVHYC